MRGRFVGVVTLAPALLLFAHLLPASGFGLALRLASAAACVLLVPGALLLRTIGWPASPGFALAGSFALSLAVDAVGLALVFAAGGSILLMAIVIASVSIVGPVISVPGATMAVPTASPSGISPVGLRRNRSSSSSCDMVVSSSRVIAMSPRNSSTVHGRRSTGDRRA